MIHRLKQAVKAVLLRRRFTGLVLGKRVDLTGVVFGRHVQVHDDVRIWWSTVGNYSYVGTGSSLIRAKLGKFCSIAPGVMLGSGSHPARKTVSSHPAFYLRRPALGWTMVAAGHEEEFAQTEVGNDVWIGARAIIRDGVTIGDGAIIGAGAVVVKDVPAFTVYGGVPARLLRARFDPDDTAFLARVRWWDRDEAWLREHVSAFADVALLRAAVGADQP